MRKEFEKRMELRRASEDGDEFKPPVRDWCLGCEAFRAEWLTQIIEKAGAGHFGKEIRESADANAERLVLEEFKKLGWGRRSCVNGARAIRRSCELPCACGRKRR